MILNFNRHKLFGILYAGWLYKHIARVFKILAHKLGVLKILNHVMITNSSFSFLKMRKISFSTKNNYNTLSVNIKS